MGGDARYNTKPVYLGVEGGGTRTIALLADGRGRILRRLELGPLNLKLSNDEVVVNALRQIRRSFTLHPSSLSLCLAGCRTATDRARACGLAARVWPRAAIFIGSDLDSGFAAAFGPHGTGILVIDGTGSCVYGRDERGQSARAGGWGHMLGDHGSGYWIALTGLRHAVRDYDRNGRINPALGKALARLCLTAPEQLIDWMTTATKDEVAALANVFLHKNTGLLLQTASFLVIDCEAVARKLHFEPAAIALAGGVLRNNPGLRKWVTHRIRTIFPRARVFQPKVESAYGALLMALECGGSTAPYRNIFSDRETTKRRQAAALQSTEQRNPRTMDLDKRSVSRLIDTMLDEEARVIPAVRANQRRIERAIGRIVAAFKRGGRLFYVGAGTSGRLGVLDASECPPTFSTDPEMVQAILAGGAPAFQGAVEAAEDDPQAGAEAIRHRGVARRDVVVGIAASGSTPFVLGALDEACRLGARTFLLCFSKPINPSTHHRILYFPTGPEVLTGSTRLKAGTATKIVLNMLTTISMIRLGKVVSNLMVDVKPTNEKLRARACRIVAALCHCGEPAARQRLIRARWNVKQAIKGKRS